MGRKPLPEGMRRNIKVQVMLTEDEMESINGALGMTEFASVSDLIRDSLMRTVKRLAKHQ